MTVVVADHSSAWPYTVAVTDFDVAHVLDAAEKSSVGRTAARLTPAIQMNNLWIDYSLVE
jgi:hypothetical protein